MAFADLRDHSQVSDYFHFENARPWAADIDRIDMDPDIAGPRHDVHLEPFEIAGLMPDEAQFLGKQARFFTDWTEFGFNVDPAGDVLADAPSLSGWKFGMSNPTNPRPRGASAEVSNLLAPIARLLAQAASRRALSQRGMTSATALLAVIVVSGALSAFHHLGVVELARATTDRLAQQD